MRAQEPYSYAKFRLGVGLSDSGAGRGPRRSNRLTQIERETALF